MSNFVSVVFNPDFENEIDANSIRDLINTLFLEEKICNTEISVALESNDTLRTLNMRFLGEDYPTDVLLFPNGAILPDSGRKYMGDIIISVEMAHTQATKKNHGFLFEIYFLIIHGFLHLMGFDHCVAQESVEMFSKQDLLLKKVLKNGSGNKE